MKLNRIGFFRELAHGDKTAESLVELLGDAPRHDEQKICEYLKNGILLIASPGVVSDVLDVDKRYIGSPSIYTDGIWAWPEVLEYYVQKYHVRLKNNFIKHIESNNYNNPTEDSVDLNNLEY